MSSLKSNFRSARHMSDEFRISLARVAKIMDSCLEDIYIVCSYWEEVTEFNNRKYIKKKSCISSQRTILKQEWPKEKVKKNKRIKHELKMNTLFSTLIRGLSEEVETLRRSSGGKQSYLATSRGVVRKEHTTIGFWFHWLTVLKCLLFNRRVMSYHPM